jgi:MFS family permease
VLSAGVSARLVARFGTKPPLVTGLLLVAAGLALLCQAPVGGHFLTDVLPGGILLGTGAGIALSPLLVAATSDLPPSEAGLASGIANTSFMLGGALGLAVLSSIATGRTQQLLTAGQGHLAALAGGYHVAYLAGAAAAAIAALAAVKGLRPAAASSAVPATADSSTGAPAATDTVTPNTAPALVAVAASD